VFSVGERDMHTRDCRWPSLRGEWTTTTARDCRYAERDEVVRAIVCRYIAVLLLHCVDCLAHKLDKVGFDASTSDEGTVDIWMSDEIFDVCRGDAAAV